MPDVPGERDASWSLAWAFTREGKAGHVQMPAIGTPSLSDHGAPPPGGTWEGAGLSVKAALFPEEACILHVLAAPGASHPHQVHFLKDRLLPALFAVPCPPDAASFWFVPGPTPRKNSKTSGLHEAGKFKP